MPCANFFASFVNCSILSKSPAFTRSPLTIQLPPACSAGKNFTTFSPFFTACATSDGETPHPAV